MPDLCHMYLSARVTRFLSKQYMQVSVEPTIVGAVVTLLQSACPVFACVSDNPTGAAAHQLCTSSQQQRAYKEGYIIAVAEQHFVIQGFGR